MSTKVRFELNRKGLAELKKTAEMHDLLAEIGGVVADNAGADYGTRVHDADYTAIVNVYPNSKKAAKENAEDNTLLKAVGAAGLPTSK